MSRSTRAIPFQDVDARAARVYALNCEIASTDTLLALIEQAFLAGCARYSHPASTLTPLIPTHQSDIPTHDPADGVPFYPVYHRNGEMRCQRVALYHKGAPSKTERADLTKLRTHPSLTIPTPHDVPRCGSCGVTIDPYSTQDLDWATLLEHTPAPVFSPSHDVPLISPLPTAPSDPGADSLSTPSAEGRTPEVDEAGSDVQPLDLLEQPEQQHGDANLQLDQISHLHQLATSLFEERRGPQIPP